MKLDLLSEDSKFSNLCTTLTRLDPATGDRTNDHVKVLQFINNATHLDKR